MGRGTATGRAVVEAFAAGDAEALVRRLAPAVVFHSPVTDYHGRERVAKVLAAVVQVVSEVRITSVFGDAAETAAFFVAGPGRADGVLLVIAADDRPATELTLMLRPLDALLAGIEQMKALLGRGRGD